MAIIAVVFAPMQRNTSRLTDFPCKVHMLHKPDVLIDIPLLLIFLRILRRFMALTHKRWLKERVITRIHISGLDAHTDTRSQPF